MDTSFKVTTHRSRSRCCEVIELAGELDFTTAQQLEAVLDGMMVVPKHIILDVSELRFIDSTGLRLFLRASTLVDGRMWVRGASRHVSRVLDLSGVAKFFCTEEDPVIAHGIISARRAGQQAS